MRITLSKKRRGEKRHCVMICDSNEAADIHHHIFHEVLGGNYEYRPDRQVLRNGKVRYRFAMRYLEALMLTFPYAEFSPGLESRLSREAQEKFEAMQVPDIEVPGFDVELRDFQKIGVGKAMEPCGHAECGHGLQFLNNDEMGLGKTYQLLAGIILLMNMAQELRRERRKAGKRKKSRPFRALVVVPNSIKYRPWGKLIHDATDCTVEVLDGAAHVRKEQIRANADITIVNVEGLRIKKRWETTICTDRACEDLEPHQHCWYEFANPGLFVEDDSIRAIRDDKLDDPSIPWKRWDVAVVDEYHRFKNPHAQQTTGLHFLWATVRWGASGTPILNGRPEEYWSILHWLWPSKFPNFDLFVDAHCKKKGSKVVAYSGLKELKEWIDQHSIRRRKDQVLDDLPEVVYATHAIDLTAEQRRLYNDIRDRLRIWINEEPRSIVSVLAQITRLKQAAFSPELYEGSTHSAKIDRVKELVEELVANGEKAIVFSQWSKATRILQRELAQYNPAYIDGTVPARDRGAQVDKFNEDENCHLFIGTIGACREGFTLSAGTYVIFTDKGWTPAENMQAAARSAAGGMRGEGVTGHVHIIEIEANDTIEQWIEELLAEKQQMNNRMVEKDGGAKVERMSMQSLRDLIFR